MKNLCLLATVSALLMTGCGGSEFTVVPVSGVVTLDGEPVAGCRVQFDPIANPGELNAGIGSYAETDAKGNFSLVTHDGQTGAVVGKHRVTLATEKYAQDAQEGALPEVPEQIPPEHRQTEFIVPAEGTSVADFKLSNTP